MVSEKLSKVEDNLIKVIAEQVAKNQEKLESQIEKVVKQHQHYAELVLKRYSERNYSTKCARRN